MGEPLSPEIWYAALSSRRGIIIRTDDPTFARQKLYAIRKGLNDPDLDNISILTSPERPDTELWIVKKTPDETT